MWQGWIIAKGQSWVLGSLFRPQLKVSFPAITIVIRYATVRRQGNSDQDGSERQIITYPSVYYRLLPILSRAYVFILLGRNLVSSLQKYRGVIQCSILIASLS